MKVDYSNERLRAACTQSRVAQRTYGDVAANALARRIKQMEAADTVADLLAGVGKWHWLNADRAGQLAGHLTGGLRIVVTPIGSTGNDASAVAVLVVDIVDYH